MVHEDCDMSARGFATSGVVLVGLCGATWMALAAPTAERAPTFNRRTGLYEPPPSMLRAALDRGDPAEVARMAERFGSARLVSALQGSDRELQLMALEAVASLGGNVRLIDAVTPLMTSADDEVAVRSARALGRMLDGAEPRKMSDWEIPPDSVKRACAALAHVAAEREAAVATRVSALEAIAQATSFCAPGGLAALLGDLAPAVRRTAAAALRATDETSTAALRQAMGDADPEVAAAASAARCRQRLAKGADGADADGDLESEAGKEEARIMRRLAQDETIPVEDAIDILSCLAAAHSDRDVRVLEQIKNGRPSPLRTRATELLAPPAAKPPR
jgi:hypothetical protein